jgi:hypothetical protein
MSAAVVDIRPVVRRRLIAGFFAGLYQRLRDEEAEDPEPEKRFTDAWYAWQRRHWDRDRQLSEVRESEALTTITRAVSPAPFACEGPEKFRAWLLKERRRSEFRG